MSSFAVSSSLRLSCLLLAALPFVACDGESESQATIVDDWLTCEDSACTRLEDEGIRFQADGILLEVEAAEI